MNIIQRSCRLYSLRRAVLQPQRMTRFEQDSSIPSNAWRHFSSVALPQDEEADDDDKNNGEPQDERTKSIAEAIAEFKAQESLRMQEKLEEARKEGEKAALARVEQDLILQQRKKAFEEWQRNVEAAKAREAAMEAKEPTVEESNDDAHPVLGPVISDLGYKRLHIVSASVLENIPVWEKQRIFRYERAKTMAADKLKTLHLGFPGVICLFEDRIGQLSVLDGQVRTKTIDSEFCR